MANRLASLGALAAGLAHEISNPLAFATVNVRSAIETLETAHRREPSLGPLLDDVLSALRDAATGNERVARVVSELRVFAEPNTGRRGHVSVADAADAAIDSIRLELEARARFVASVPPDLAVVADRARLRQVLVALLTNAIGAIPEGAAAANEISLAARVSERRVVISVTDSGSGIPDGLQSRIFEPFSSMKFGPTARSEAAGAREAPFVVARGHM